MKDRNRAQCNANIDSPEEKRGAAKEYRDETHLSFEVLKRVNQLSHEKIPIQVARVIALRKANADKEVVPDGLDAAEQID